MTWLGGWEEASIAGSEGVEGVVIVVDCEIGAEERGKERGCDGKRRERGVSTEIEEGVIFSRDPDRIRSDTAFRELEQRVIPSQYKDTTPEAQRR